MYIRNEGRNVAKNLQEFILDERAYKESQTKGNMFKPKHIGLHSYQSAGIRKNVYHVRQEEPNFENDIFAEDDLRQDQKNLHRIKQELRQQKEKLKLMQLEKKTEGQQAGSLADQTATELNAFLDKLRTSKRSLLQTDSKSKKRDTGWKKVLLNSSSAPSLSTADNTQQIHNDTQNTEEGGASVQLTIHQRKVLGDKLLTHLASLSPERKDQIGAHLLKIDQQSIIKSVDAKSNLDESKIIVRGNKSINTQINETNVENNVSVLNENTQNPHKLEFRERRTEQSQVKEEQPAEGIETEKMRRALEDQERQKSNFAKLGLRLANTEEEDLNDTSESLKVNELKKKTPRVNIINNGATKSNHKSKPQEKLRPYINQSYKEKDDMFQVIRDIAANGEKMVQVDRSREYAEYFEPSDSDQSTVIIEEGAEDEEDSESSLHRMQTGFNSLSRQLTQQKSFLSLNRQATQRKQIQSNNVPKVKAYDINPRTKRDDLQMANEMDPKVDAFEEDLHEKQLMLQLAQERRLLFEFKESMRNPNWNKKDQQKTQHEILLDKQLNEREFKRPELLSETVHVLTRSGKKIAPIRFVDKNAAKQAIEMEKRQNAAFAEEIEANRQRKMDEAKQVLQGLYNNEKMSKMKIIQREGQAVQNEVEEALIKKYEFLIKKPPPLPEKEKIKTAIKGPLQDHVLAKNKKYFKSYAQEKRLWVGGEGEEIQRFKNKDLQPWFNVYDQTRLLKIQNTVQDERQKHLDLLKVGFKVDHVESNFKLEDSMASIDSEELRD